MKRDDVSRRRRETAGAGRAAGAGRRARLAAAVAVVCAVTLLGAPGAAFAAPAPPAPAAGSAHEPLTTAQLESVRAHIDELYQKAGRATDAFNAAEERRADQAEQVDLLSTRVAKGEQRLTDLRDRLAAAAVAQYRSGGAGLSVGQRLLLSDDPQDFLDTSELARQGQRGSTLLLDQLDATQKKLDADKKDAAALLERLEKSRAKKDSARKEVKKQIKAAELLESQLEKKEKERLRKLEEAAARKAQAGWVDTGALKGLGGAASTQGAKALAYASAQLGKPYVWGAEGPASFDCSGLTSQAWQAAGRPIPRTSQEQWKQLKHVAVASMRPGDLIIYHADASHVGMYVGGGRIIHAPRPGRTVTVAGAGSMQILGVVRPDPEAKPAKETKNVKESTKGSEKGNPKKDVKKEAKDAKPTSAP